MSDDREKIIPYMSTYEEFQKWMKDEVIPEVTSSVDGDVVWIAVPSGRRRDCLFAIRTWLKENKYPSSIENVLKVVEEEKYEDDEYTLPCTD